MAKNISTTIAINAKQVTVEWTKTAALEMDKRMVPIVVELRLYFSCLVKKVVYFHEAAPDRDVLKATDKLSLFFRPVTSTACTFDVAERLGHQPEIDLDNPNVRKMAPKRVEIDFIKGKWRGEFWM